MNHPLIQTIHRSRQENIPISISGARHAMGGQQFGTNTLHSDTRSLNKVLNFDRDKGLSRVEARIDWIKLIDDLLRIQTGQSKKWTINQKQTGADRLTLGGALSAKAHGRRLTHNPMIQDVESFTLIGPDGVAKRCSREHNPELFGLAIGGYGLFGPIYSINVRLIERHKVRRKVTVEHLDGIIQRFEERIRLGFEYEDFQF